MRTLSATLTAAQQSNSVSPLAKIVLSYGANEYTYTYPSQILRLTHPERQWSHTAEVVIDDTDKTLHSLNLEGYEGVISYGFTTASGDEYSATAPLKVIGQQRDSYQGKLICSLSLEGVFDRLGRDKASATYTQESTDTNTVKTLITAIAGATLAPYTHCKAYTVTYDSEDSLIDTFIPADFFRVGLNDSRLSKIMELLAYTTCKARIENDGEIHIFTPTTTGVSYDYEYRLEDTYHTFLSKRFRRRVVSPNYVVVSNHPDQGAYTGYAKDDSADLTDMEEREHRYARATSDAQCTSLATAILSRYQLEAEKGAGILPIMNIGSEIYDYVSINDTRAGDNAVGNIGWITRNIEAKKFSMDFGFGKASLIPLEAMASIAAGEGLTAQQIRPVLDSIYSNINQIIDILEQTASIEEVNKVLNDLFEDAHFRKLTVHEQLIIPTWTP